MGDYQPASRRPIAAFFRKTATLAVRFCVKHNIHPDLISYLSILAAAGAALCFYLSAHCRPLLLIAPLLCFLRLWCNMLDGMVALASGKASPRGEIVNELPDRISDLLIFIGIAHSHLANPFLAYWAAILALMTAYIGTLGQAVTGHRRFEGLMSKQHRILVLAIGAWTAFFLKSTAPLGFSILDWTLFLILAGCIQTIIVRLRKMLSELRGAS